MIGLAVGVDYSLFYLRREREERAAGRDEVSALEVAAATSGRAVLISGLTVLVAMAGMFISGDKAFISFAYGTMIVVGDRDVRLAHRAAGGARPGSATGSRRGGSRSSAGVGAREASRASGPRSSIASPGARGSRSCSPAARWSRSSIPALHMKTVISGVDDLPQDLAVIKTYNQVKDVFPSEGVTTTVVVEADNVRAGDVATPDRRAQGSGQGVRLVPARDLGHLQRRRHRGRDRHPQPRQRHRRRLDRRARRGPQPDRPGDRRRGRRDHGQRQRRCGAVAGLPRSVQQQAAADLRLRLRARFPAAAGHLPLDRDPDQGDRAQPALRRRRLRGRGPGLPGRSRRVAARLHLQRRRRLVAAAVPVRDPVRALDGLPRVHPLPGPRGLRLGDEHRRRRAAARSRPPPGR